MCVSDGSLSRLQRKMVEGSAMDTGERGANKVDSRTVPLLPYYTCALPYGTVDTGHCLQ